MKLKKSVCLTKIIGVVLSVVWSLHAYGYGLVQAPNTVVQDINPTGSCTFGALIMCKFSPILAVTPDNSTVYVLHPNNSSALTGQVVAVDTYSGEATCVSNTQGTNGINNPFLIGITPDGTKGYIVNDAAPYTVGILNVATNTISGYFSLGGTGSFRNLVMHPDGTRAYIMNYLGASPIGQVIDVYSDTISGTITNPYGFPCAPETGGGMPISMAISPDGHTGYTNNGAIINLDTNEVVGCIANPYSACPFPSDDSYNSGIALNAAGTKAYIPSSNGGVIVMDLITQTVLGCCPFATGCTPIDIGGDPVCVATAGNALYVGRVLEFLQLVDMASDTIVSIFDSMQHVADPVGMVASADGTTLYVLTGSSGTPNSLYILKGQDTAAFSDTCTLQQGNTVTNTLVWQPYNYYTAQYGNTSIQSNLYRDPYGQYLIATVPLTCELDFDSVAYYQFFYQDTNLDPNTTYNYYASFIDINGIESSLTNLPLSGFCNGPIYPPDDLQGCVSNQGGTVANTLTWSPPYTGIEVNYYAIYNDPSLTYPIGTVAAGGPLVFVDVNLDPNHTYTYYITSVNAPFEWQPDADLPTFPLPAPESEPVSITLNRTTSPACASPILVSACITQQGNTITNTISWGPPYAEIPDGSSYAIYRNDPSLTTPIDTVPDYGPLVFVDAGLNPDIAYTYYIVGVYYGEIITAPLVITPFLFCYGELLPPTVTGCKSEVDNVTTNILTWTAPDQGLTPIAYNIYRDAYLTDLIVSVPAYEPFIFEEIALYPEESYTYYIVSLDEEGNRSYPAIVTITTPCLSIFPPASVSGCRTQNRFFLQTDFINRITWTPPAMGTNPAAYRIYRDANLTQLAATVPAIQFQYVDHNRNPSIVYSYYIVSVDANGNLSTATSVMATDAC